MSSTRAEVELLISEKILSGGRRTTAENARIVYLEINESSVNKIDDANVVGGYLAISPEGLIDISFIKKETPTGQFLKDDGSWADATADLSGYLQKSGYLMDTGAQGLFAGAIDIQSNGVIDYSKSWYYGDENYAQMGFGFNHYLSATPSLIEMVALATNSIYQIISDSASENIRLVANKNSSLAEFIVNPGLAATYRNTNNLPIKYFGDYFDGDVRSLVDWGTVKTYADGLVAGLIDDRGSYDASSNLYPSTGGSGTAGAILKGDLWYISVAGTLGGKAVSIGDSVRSLTDSPGQTDANWDVLETNIGYVPLNKAGDTVLGNLLFDSETASTIAHFDSSKNLKSLPLATYPSLTELSYVKGVTSAIQSQLDGKSALVGSYRRIAHDYTSAAGTAVTTEEVLKVIPVSSSVVYTGDMLEVYSTIGNTSNVNTKTWRMYINTSPDLSGSPVKIATGQYTTNTQSSVFSKKIPVISLTSVFCYGGPTTSGLSPYGSVQASSTIETVPDLSSAFYIIITSQKSVSTDGMTINYAELYLTKN